MPTTLDALKRQLSSIEIDRATYAELGPADVPLLVQLLDDPETWLAARAVFALSLIASDDALPALARAAADPRPQVRIAVAASAANLPAAAADPLLLQALSDRDTGVRKFAIRSVAPQHGAGVQAKLRDLEGTDEVPWLREAASARLAEVRREP